MTGTDRRKFLQLLGSSSLAAALPQSIDRALAIPAHNEKGGIEDIEHIVVLMQENRSFDHYFGTMRGVRGFGDPHPIKLPSGKPVWYQPDGNSYLLPFHPSADNLGAQFLEGTPHNWPDSHGAWNNGKYDGWIANKGRTTMAHLERQDIPFHYALAEAFTICDAYYCSLMGATDPNRYHMWTGWCGNDGAGDGPVVDNSEAGYGWHTYPERLEQAGIGWKIYQDIGDGLDQAGFWGWTGDPYIGNYGDNSLLYFRQYQNALPGSPLYERARRGTNIKAGGTLFDILRFDVANNKLPQISWIASPEAFSEHSNWPSNYGAWYISQVLDALTSNRKLWSKTALFVTYDENDGFFDHLVPPTPPSSPAFGKSTVPIANEIYPGNGSYYAPGPYGLGSRVPMIVVSPWSKGGWVNSQVFDHTSLIRFIEQRFARQNPKLVESNITPWRRAVCGDLTSAFDFKTPNAARPRLPDTDGFEPTDKVRHPDYSPMPPRRQRLPRQERGLRWARAIPYELHAIGRSDTVGGVFRIVFVNTGKAGACFHVRSALGSEGPWSFTVEAGKSLSESWALAPQQGRYDLSVHGPNGFLRGFRGVAGAGRTNLDIDCSYDDDLTLAVTLTNRSTSPARLVIKDVYGDETTRPFLAPGSALKTHWRLKSTHGWYDLVIGAEGDGSFERRMAGHIEDGRDSMSDPAFGMPRGGD
jgi:phospholipase C